MKLTLNDGSVLENSYLILSGDMFLYINGSSMRTVFDLLIVPDNVKKIVYTDVAGNDTVYTGYKKLKAVRDEGDGLITAVLTK